jgi:DEAD/DEAH box helicase domain-containing protein
MKALNLLVKSAEATIVDRHDIAARPERLRKPPEAYRSKPMARWLSAMTGGGDTLWLHQTKALESLAAGRNVVLATGTGSGKSLVFQADMVRRMVDDPAATGLALYPAKSLASDQLVRWREAFRRAGLDEDQIVEVHGDIPSAEREGILKRARLIVGTEDVVHAWFMRLLAADDAQQFLRALQLVVVDEAHDLEGVFGSNCAFLFRRMRAARHRSLRSAGLRPGEIQFVAASATIADPAGHLEALTGLDFDVIGEADNGAPRHPKILLHIEGPEYGAVAEANLSELVGRLASEIAPDALIAFADGRQMVERVASNTGSEEVEPYRAGFEFEDRSAIADALRKGRLRAIVATSALELGINVPQFNMGLNVGVPLSTKAFRQRVGRIGRSGPGVFAVIAEPSAFAKLGTSLAEFYEGAAEKSPLYLENSIIQFQNACCLLEECGGDEVQPGLPGEVAWPDGFAEAYLMAQPGAIRPREIEHVARHASGSPHIEFPLRRIGDGKLALRLHKGSGELVGTIDDGKALREAYPGGIYRHRKVPYQVLDWRLTGYERSIYLMRIRGAGRTTPIFLTQVGVSHEDSELHDGHLLSSEHGSFAEVRMQVTESVIGYRCGKADRLYRDLSQTDRRLSRKHRHFSTTGIVIRIDEPWFRGRGGSPAEMRDRVGRALATVLTRDRGISPGEVRWEQSGIAMHGSGGPRVLEDALVIFDDLSGGLRLTSPLFEQFEYFLERLKRGAELAGGDALLDEISVARLERWYASLVKGNPGRVAAPALPPHQRLVYAPDSRVGVRIHGALLERQLLGHQLVELGGSEHLVYAYESSPGVKALVPHEQIEPIGHDWRQLIWDSQADTLQEIAA